MTDTRKPEGATQLELALPSSEKRTEASAALRAPRTAPALKLIRGEGLKETERLDSRDAVVRVLLETGTDMLLRRISVDRAEEIEQSVDKVLDLFDRVDHSPAAFAELQSELENLELLAKESRAVRRRPPTP